MAIQQFYTPKKLYTPQNKFLATPLLAGLNGQFFAEQAVVINLTKNGCSYPMTGHELACPFLVIDVFSVYV